MFRRRATPTRPRGRVLVDPRLEDDEALRAYPIVLRWAAGRCDRFALLIETSRAADEEVLAALRSLGRSAKVTLANPVGGLANLFFGAYRYEQREGRPDAALVDALTRFRPPPEGPGDLCPAAIVALKSGERILYWCGDYGRDQVLDLTAPERSDLEGELGDTSMLVAAPD